MPSPRAVLPVLGWCVATLAAIALASVLNLHLLPAPAGDAVIAPPASTTPPASNAPAPAGDGKGG